MKRLYYRNEYLKELYESKKITKAAISRASGKTSPRILTEFVSGSNLRVGELTSICNGLGLDVTLFFIDEQGKTLYSDIELLKEEVVNLRQQNEDYQKRESIRKQYETQRKREDALEGMASRAAKEIAELKTYEKEFREELRKAYEIQLDDKVALINLMKSIIEDKTAQIKDKTTQIEEMRKQITRLTEEVDRLQYGGNERTRRLNDPTVEMRSPQP